MTAHRVPSSSAAKYVMGVATIPRSITSTPVDRMPSASDIAKLGPDNRPSRPMTNASSPCAFPSEATARPISRTTSSVMSVGTIAAFFGHAIHRPAVATICARSPASAASNAARSVKNATITSAGPLATTSPSPVSTSPSRTSTRDPGLMPSFFGSGVPLYVWKLFGRSLIEALPDAKDRAATRSPAKPSDTRPEVAKP